MATELSCFPDYCLACDKQTQGDTYCSQSCRLADLGSSSTWSGPSSTSPANRNSGLYLAPAINFAAYKTPSHSPAAYQSASHTALPLASYFPGRTSDQVAAPKTLTPSSSQSSLCSTRSTSVQPTQTNSLSEHARTELLGYTNSFDNVRNWRKRMTWS